MLQMTTDMFHLKLLAACGGLLCVVADSINTNQYDKTSVMIYHVIADSINTTLIVQINMTKQV